VLCDDARIEALAAILLCETSTFGLRVQRMERYCLRREAASVATPFGEIAVKIGYWGSDVLKVTPEYESCRAAADASGKPLGAIYAAAQKSIQEKYFKG
jgi:uncharacterized protein (DUF111 family)